MEKLVIKLKGDHKDYDRMSIHMDHPELENPINIPFMKINEITGEMIMNTISKVMQSKKSLTLDNKMNLKTTVF